MTQRIASPVWLASSLLERVPFLMVTFPCSMANIRFRPPASFRVLPWRSRSSVRVIVLSIMIVSASEARAAFSSSRALAASAEMVSSPVWVSALVSSSSTGATMPSGTLRSIVLVVPSDAPSSAEALLSEESRAGAAKPSAIASARTARIWLFFI